jgi:hypothetical protein
MSNQILTLNVYSTISFVIGIWDHAGRLKIRLLAGGFPPKGGQAAYWRISFVIGIWTLDISP